MHNYAIRRADELENECVGRLLKSILSRCSEQSPAEESLYLFKIYSGYEGVRGDCIQTACTQHFELAIQIISQTICLKAIFYLWELVLIFA